MDFIGLKQILETDNGLGVADWLRRNYSSFPEFWFVDNLMNGVEHVHYHHEGDVWTHTLLVIQKMSENAHDYVDMLCALLHDIGKKDALEKNAGKDMHGHERLGIPLARQVLDMFGVPTDVAKDILWVIENHTKANDLVKSKSKYDCWKFVNEPLFYRARRLAVADSLGTLGEDGLPKMDYEAELANSVAGRCLVDPMPEPVVSGGDLAQYLSQFEITDIDEALDLCHKIQINGNVANKDSIIRNAIKCLNQRKQS